MGRAVPAHDGQPCKLTLEGFPALATARALATDALEQVDQGHDPASDKRSKRQVEKAVAAAQSSLEEAFIEFLDKYTHRRGRAIRESSRRESARLLGLKRNPENEKEWIATGGGVLAHWRRIKSIKDVTYDDVYKLLDDMVKPPDPKVKAAPVSANRTLSALKTCFKWHVKRRKLAASVCADIDDPAPEGRERQRKRVLTEAELAALWRACESEALYGSMVRLLILTGCRRNEVRGARWSEFDLDKREWSLPAERVKNGVEHLVPITDMVNDILAKLSRVVDRQSNDPLLFTTNGRTPISGLSKIKKRIEEAMAKELGHHPKQWGLHDLRRTFISGLQALGVVREEREACVNHRSAQSGVAGVYERHEYWQEKQRAFGLWNRHVAKVVGSKAGKPDKPGRPRKRAKPRRVTSDKAAPLHAGGR